MRTTIPLDPPLFGLLRIFAERQHAEQFVQGNLYLNTVKFFQKSAEKVDARGDNYEGTFHSVQPGSISSLTIAGVKMGGKIIHEFCIRRDTDLLSNIYCLYGFHGGAGFDTLEDARERLLVPAETAQLGDSLVFIKDVQMFLDRVGQALQREGLSLKLGQVQYLDDSQFTHLDSPLLCERKKYAHQKEIRIIVRRPILVDQPLRLNVGDLSDIVELKSVEEFNANFRVQWRGADGTSQVE